MLLSVVLAGCAASEKHAAPPTAIRPQLDADQTQLVESYNRQADAVHALNASVQMSPTAGSAYSGVIHQYHEVSGFILAARPALIRVIGQAPIVSTNIFDNVMLDLMKKYAIRATGIALVVGIILGWLIGRIRRKPAAQISA